MAGERWLEPYVTVCLRLLLEEPLLAVLGVELVDWGLLGSRRGVTSRRRLPTVATGAGDVCSMTSTSLFVSASVSSLAVVGALELRLRSGTRLSGTEALLLNRSAEDGPTTKSSV